MYFNSKNNFYHGIMFHHFHDDNLYKKSQGSINKDDFYRLINFIGRKNILNADEFFYRFKENTLKPKNICLTFETLIELYLILKGAPVQSVLAPSKFN